MNQSTGDEGQPHQCYGARRTNLVDAQLKGGNRARAAGPRVNISAEGAVGTRWASWVKVACRTRGRAWIIRLCRGLP